VRAISFSVASNFAVKYQSIRQELIAVRKLIAGTTIAIATVLGTAPAVAALSTATVYHSAQAEASSSPPNIYYHS
jgi:hypothetical protein